MPKNKLKTKKLILGFKRKKQTNKRQYGGEVLNNATNNNTVNKIMEQVKSARKMDLGKIEIVQKVQGLLTGLFLKATENIAKLANININDPSSIEQKLEQIKSVLVNPANKERVKKIMDELSKEGIIAIQAASPFLQDFLDKGVNIGTKTLSEIGEAIVKIGLNTAEEIPGVGILIGTIRSIGNGGEAITSATNAAAQVVTSYSDALNGAILNFKKITQESSDRLNNINKSINDFNQTPLNMTKNISSQLPQVATNMMMYQGGKHNRYKKYSRRKN
jgi:hypothetical protein